MTDLICTEERPRLAISFEVSTLQLETRIGKGPELTKN